MDVATLSVIRRWALRAQLSVRGNPWPEQWSWCPPSLSPLDVFPLYQNTHLRSGAGNSRRRCLHAAVAWIVICS